MGLGHIHRTACIDARQKLCVALIYSAPTTGLVAGAVAEIMRYDGPADTTLLRVATAEVEIDGVPIKPGDA